MMLTKLIAAVVGAISAMTFVTPHYSNWMEELIPQVDPHHEAHWHFASHNGHVGWTDDGLNIYIDPDTSNDHLSVMTHEFAHVHQFKTYGSLSALLSVWDVPALESMANCITELHGLTPDVYGCDESLMDTAKKIDRGEKP